MKPRIVHIINNLDAIGGAELALVRLLERRTPDRFRHEVVALLEIDRLAPRLRAVDVQVAALGLGRVGLGLPMRMLGGFTGPRPALYVGWMYYSNLFASLLGTMRNVPVLWNVLHSLHDVSRSGFSTHVSIAASKLVAQQPAHIVYNSATSAAQHRQRGWPARKAQVIHTGVDPQLFVPGAERRERARAALGVADDTLLIGRFGRYHLLKGYETLLHAYAQVLPPRSTRLLLGGRELDRSNTKLVALIEQLKLGERVQLLGERDDLPALLPGFDLCVSSSHSESFPNVVAEAMASGVPCVATDVGDSRAMVGHAGWIVPPDDVPALAAGLARALNSIALDAAPWRTAAREHTLLHFSVQYTVAAFETLFATVLRDAPDSVAD